MGDILALHTSARRYTPRRVPRLTRQPRVGRDNASASLGAAQDNPAQGFRDGVVRRRLPPGGPDDIVSNDFAPREPTTIWTEARELIPNTHVKAFR
ncbi:unnamed protein product, partial [Musa textilis]